MVPDELTRGWQVGLIQRSNDRARPLPLAVVAVLKPLYCVRRCQVMIRLTCFVGGWMVWYTNRARSLRSLKPMPGQYPCVNVVGEAASVTLLGCSEATRVKIQRRSPKRPPATHEYWLHATPRRHMPYSHDSKRWRLPTRRSGARCDLATPLSRGSVSASWLFNSPRFRDII